MSNAETKKVAVVVETERGYAVVSPERWREILDGSRWVKTIRACKTWGEYRSLGDHPFEDAVESHAAREGIPDDDGDPFPWSLPFADEGGEGEWDRYAKLESSTTNFFENLEGETELLKYVENYGPWSYVARMEVEEVIRRLKDLGYVVHESGFGDEEEERLGENNDEYAEWFPDDEERLLTIRLNAQEFMQMVIADLEKYDADVSEVLTSKVDLVDENGVPTFVVDVKVLFDDKESAERRLAKPTLVDELTLRHESK
jgi:hypothetical protein